MIDPDHKFSELARYNAWIWAEKEARLLDHWAAGLDPSVKGVVASELVRPEPFTMDGVYDVRQRIISTFYDVFRALPGETIDKFKRLGSPRMLQHLCGMTDTPMNENGWCLEVHREITGSKPTLGTDARSKPVREAATGIVWPSATDLAIDLKCAKISVYKHLGGGLKTIKGRVFEYVPGVNRALTAPLIDGIVK